VVKRFSRAALELFWAPVDPARQHRLADVVGEYHAVLSRFAGTAGGSGGAGSGGAGGLVGALREQGQTPEQVVAALFFLLVAGQETTSQFLTLLMDRLIAEPAVTGALVAGRVRVEDVVEEGLRLDSPIETWRRVAAVDTRLGDVDVPAGSPVLLWLSRAGRDPALAQAPERFLPGQRHSRRHLAFGAGAHRCVGAPLARMEAAVVVAETAPLLRRVVAERRPTCPDNLSFRVPDTLLVTRPG
jgi:cytochrome P450